MPTTTHKHSHTHTLLAAPRRVGRERRYWLDTPGNQPLPVLELSRTSLTDSRWFRWRPPPPFSIQKVLYEYCHTTVSTQSLQKVRRFGRKRRHWYSPPRASASSSVGPKVEGQPSERPSRTVGGAGWPVASALGEPGGFSRALQLPFREPGLDPRPRPPQCTGARCVVQRLVHRRRAYPQPRSPAPSAERADDAYSTTGEYQ